MWFLPPPTYTKTATTAHRNVAERSNQNSKLGHIKTHKSQTPGLNPTGSLSKKNSSRRFWWNRELYRQINQMVSSTRPADQGDVTLGEQRLNMATTVRGKNGVGCCLPGISSIRYNGEQWGEIHDLLSNRGRSPLKYESDCFENYISGLQTKSQYG